MLESSIRDNVLRIKFNVYGIYAIVVERTMVLIATTSSNIVKCILNASGIFAVGDFFILLHRYTCKIDYTLYILIKYKHLLSLCIYCMIPTNVISEDEDMEYEEIRHDIQARINEQIMIGKFSAMRTDDQSTCCYYLRKFLTNTYTVHSNMITKGDVVF